MYIYWSDNDNVGAYVSNRLLTQNELLDHVDAESKREFYDHYLGEANTAAEAWSIFKHEILINGEIDGWIDSGYVKQFIEQHFGPIPSEPMTNLDFIRQAALMNNTDALAHFLIAVTDGAYITSDGKGSEDNWRAWDAVEAEKDWLQKDVFEPLRGDIPKWEFVPQEELEMSETPFSAHRTRRSKQ